MPHDYQLKALSRLSEDEKREWMLFWERCDAANFFNAPDFFEACIEALGHSRQLIIFAYQGGALVGVLPLVRERVFGIRCWAYPGKQGNLVDKSLALIDARYPEVFEALVHEAQRFGSVYLAEIEAQDREAALNLFPHTPALAELASVSRTLPLAAETDVLQYMSDNQRKKLIRRSQKQSGLDFRFVDPQVIEHLETAIAIEQRSRKIEQSKDLLQSPRAPRLLRAIIRRNPASVRIGILSVQGRPIATTIGFAAKGTYGCYHVAFDEQETAWGAGKAAIWLTYDALRQEGFRLIDQLRGDSALKAQFARAVHKQYHLYVARSPWTRAWWRIAMRAYRWLKERKAWWDDRQAKRKAPMACKRASAVPGRSAAKPHLVISSYDDLENPFYGGGGAQAVHEVAKRLLDEYSVTVLTGRFPGAAQETAKDGVRYRRIGSVLLGPRGGQLLFHFLLPFSAFRLRYDLWLESFTPPFSTSFLPWWTKRPVIGLAHMFSGADMRRKYGLPFERLEAFGLRRYRHLITLTPAAHDFARARNARADIRIIGNGIDFEAYQKIPKPATGAYLSFLGRIEMDQKGLDVLLPAYREVAERVGLPLHIAGAGTEKDMQALQRLIHALGLEDRVVLRGRLSAEESAVFLRESFLHVVPSRFEMLSLSALEALAAGTPLVVSPIQGLAWIPDECVFRAAALDTPHLAEALLAAVQAPELRTRKAEAGLQLARTYDWDQAATEYKAFFRDALGKQKALPPVPESDILRRAIREKIPCYFISPHLDDAVLSAGGLLNSLASQTEVTVVSCFTEASQKTLTLSAWAFLRQCGWKSASRLFAARRQEDRAVLEGRGIKAVHLGFQDALWRQRKSNPLLRGLGWLLPELVALYPTYRFHISRGKIAPGDRELVTVLGSRLEALIGHDTRALVFCPVATGTHIDHVITRQATESAFGPVVLWQDFPYQAAEQGAGLRPLFSWRAGRSAKRKMIEGYQTQAKAMFPEGIPDQEERYFADTRFSDNDLLQGAASRAVMLAASQPSVPAALAPEPRAAVPASRAAFRWGWLGQACVVVFAASILALSVRGLPGNPTPDELKLPAWNVTGPFESSNDRGRYALLHALMEDGRVTFSPALAAFAAPDLAKNGAGDYVSLFAPGTSFLVAPGYLFGRALGAAQVGTYAAVAVFALLNLLLIQRIARHFGASQAAAWLGGITFVFATPAYSYAVSLSQHHLSTFILLFALWLYLRFDTWLSLAGIWFLCALSIAVDNPNLFLLFPLGLVALGRVIWLDLKPGVITATFRPARILAFGGVALPLLFFAWFNTASQGSPWVLSGTLERVLSPEAAYETQGDRETLAGQAASAAKQDAVGFFKTRNLYKGFHTHLISQDRGVLTYAPVTLAGLWGLALLYRRQRGNASLLLAIVAVNLLLYSMWGDPWGGWAFGSRYLIPAYAILAIGVSYALHAWRARALPILAFVVLFAYAVSINALGALGTSVIPPSSEVLRLEELTGHVQKDTYERSWDYLQTTGSKAFVYQAYLDQHLTAPAYYLLLVSLLSLSGGALASAVIAAGRRQT